MRPAVGTGVADLSIGHRPESRARNTRPLTGRVEPPRLASRASRFSGGLWPGHSPAEFLRSRRATMADRSGHKQKVSKLVVLKDSQETALMKAAVLHAAGEPLRLEEVRLADPGPGEVLVRVQAAGVCHSDLHYMTGDLTCRLPGRPRARGRRASSRRSARGPRDRARRRRGAHVAPAVRPVRVLPGRAAGAVRRDQGSGGYRRAARRHQPALARRRPPGASLPGRVLLRASTAWSHRSRWSRSRPGPRRGSPR